MKRIFGMKGAGKIKSTKIKGLTLFTIADAGFSTEMVQSSAEGFVISWHSVTGRVYDVLWTPGLQRGFQILETGLKYPVNCYTDVVHAASASGYYMVSVRLPGGSDTDGDGLPNSWETIYFSDAIVADAGHDSDGDGLNNISEYLAGTDPTNANSCLLIDRISQIPSGTVIQWSAVTGRVYSVLWSSRPSGAYNVIQSGMAYPQNSCTDLIHSAEDSGFYRIDVEKSD